MKCVTSHKGDAALDRNLKGMLTNFAVDLVEAPRVVQQFQPLPRMGRGRFWTHDKILRSHTPYNLFTVFHILLSDNAQPQYQKTKTMMGYKLDFVRLYAKFSIHKRHRVRTDKSSDKNISWIIVKLKGRPDLLTTPYFKTTILSASVIASI